MKSLCVYCGASSGADAVYAESARELGAVLAKKGIRLVYGGGNVGLMGIVADAVLANGGQVIGVIPQSLVARELSHDGLSEQHVVNSMHERKAMMEQLSDGFIALPGGWGTLDEMFEMLTWAQLGFHKKPVGLLNVKGYYDGLIAFVLHQVQEGFVKPQQATLLLHETDAATLVERLLQS